MRQWRGGNFILDKLLSMFIYHSVYINNQFWKKMNAFWIKEINVNANTLIFWSNNVIQFLVNITNTG